MNSISQHIRQQALQLMCFLEAQPDLSFEQAYHLFQTWLPSLEAEDIPLVPDDKNRVLNHQTSVKSLVQSALVNQKQVDSIIQEASHHWRLERMSWVDRNLLRLTAYELIFLQTPPKILINEAIELAKKYSSSASAPFINGILDSIYRKHVKQSNIS